MKFQDTVSVFPPVPPLAFPPTLISILLSISKYFSASILLVADNLFISPALSLSLWGPTVFYSVLGWFFFSFLSASISFLSIHWRAPSAFILLDFHLLGMYSRLHFPLRPNLNYRFQLNYLRFKLFISGFRSAIPSWDIPPLAIS